MAGVFGKYFCQLVIISASLTCLAVTIVSNEPLSGGLAAGKQMSVKTHSRHQLLDHLKRPVLTVQNIESLPTNVKSWIDERLSWLPSEFNNISEIVVPGHFLWSPDIGILNSVSDIYHVVRDTRFEMKIENSGQVWWHPTGIVKTYCKLRLQYFPFDQQKCSIVFESPTLDVRFMNLTLRSSKNGVDTSMYIDGETWKLVRIEGHNMINKISQRATFARVEFVICIQRAQIYHILNVITPAIFLSMVQGTFFFLPPTHPQRVGSATTTLLSVVVFHSIAMAQLPKTSEHVPLLAIYIIIVVFICATSVCTSIVLARFAVYAEQNQPLPALFQRIHRPFFWSSQSKMTKTTQVPKPTNRDVFFTENVDASEEAKHELLFKNWHDVSTTVDQCLFVVAFGLAVISPIVLFIILPLWHDHNTDAF